ncbi:MAG: hypothetical protein IJ599_00755 [Alphaproteobacteria bacterium]|nr:hypothetical protein [Alphaproteobacteria bacterium]
MNTGKILSAIALAVVATQGASATGASSDRAVAFYVGLDSGASFDKFSAGGREAIEAGGMDVFITEFPKRQRKKITPIVDILFGVEGAIKSFFVAGELFVGARFRKFKKDDGKLIDVLDAKSYDVDFDVLSVKNSLDWGGIFKFGYAIVPQLKLYAGVGLNCSWMKYKYTLELGDADKLVGTTRKTGSKKKIKFSPILAVGASYDILDDVYAKVEYNCCFAEHFKVGGFFCKESSMGRDIQPLNVKLKSRLRSQIVKLGFGIRF